MSFNTEKIDLLLQYALLLAGEEDEFFDRQLGPIHMIKYVYLADLCFARRNEGETFTGIDWQFYKFGPWTQSVNKRIEPALLAIGADKKSFQSNYEDKDDWVRWCLRDEYLLKDKERELPACITLHLKRYVHKFGKNTPDLLDYVYCTKPMLNAAPNEYLDFSILIDHVQDAEPKQPLKMEKLSTKKKKKFKEGMQVLQNKQKGLKSKKIKLINPVKNARYDSVYEEGVSWLDELAGEKFTPGEKVTEFSSEVWKSPARKGEDEDVS